jgi:VIT1/CCC1 family predicted Fe2+/Mn2+ transporter
MAISKGRAMAHVEEHSVQRIGWLRAAVLGANDGLVSTASLITGVAASQAPTSQILIAGAAGLIAGAMSMAAGEYVSVSSQSDTEKADLEELAETFAARGVSRETALAVARELTAADALAAHAREELGITEVSTARPLQAAVTSAITFAVGAALPLAVVVLAPASALLPVVAVSTLVFLALLGALGARAGGAPPLKGAVRVTIWGAAALAITAAAGALFGASV